jgi:hypothetical protein
VCQAGCGHGDFQPEQKSSQGPRRKYILAGPSSLKSVNIQEGASRRFLPL